jgi:hypothetical protein
MKRFVIGTLLALLAGFGLGLAYAWLISPLRVFDSEPAALRADFKDHFRSAIAASYAATGNLPRAQTRLSLLGDADPVEALNAQAQRMIASGDSFKQADQLAALAFAIENGADAAPTATPATEVTTPIGVPFTATQPPPLQFTETPQSFETQPVFDTATPRPTRTPIPTQGVPFALISQDIVCDPNLPEGLLQVIVFNASRRQLAGVKIIIAWDAVDEQFFTGLKPELGNGYADYLMTPNTNYTLQLALGSDIATGLIAPACQTSSGESYWGGFKLTFQQP